ncbi:hypothetical protein [Mycobacterium scrofulaceum]|uniref:hypothetical protein n=1 Tax=Mycobacterium scrofulaceum TaxID=1783 RepID=UPI0012EAC2E6|nr:hypothetical protein [Mycobacterium scrofulaceum]
MKAQMRTAVALFGGMAAVALAIGFGALGVSPAGAAATHSPSGITPAPAVASGVHPATLAGCVSGLDC